MRKHTAVAALVALLLGTSGLTRARAAAGDDMQKVWPAFQAAVAVNDKARGGKPVHRYTLIFENGDDGFRCVALATGD